MNGSLERNPARLGVGLAELSTFSGAEERPPFPPNPLSLQSLLRAIADALSAGKARPTGPAAQILPFRRKGASQKFGLREEFEVTSSARNRTNSVFALQKHRIGTRVRYESRIGGFLIDKKKAPKMGAFLPMTGLRASRRFAPEALHFSSGRTRNCSRSSSSNFLRKNLPMTGLEPALYC